MVIGKILKKQILFVYKKRTVTQMSQKTLLMMTLIMQYLMNVLIIQRVSMRIFVKFSRMLHIILTAFIFRI